MQQADCLFLAGIQGAKESMQSMDKTTMVEELMLANGQHLIDERCTEEIWKCIPDEMGEFDFGGLQK